MVRAALLACLVMLTSAALPTASAALIPSHAFHGDLSAMAFGENQSKMAFSVLTGASEVSGSAVGLFALSRVHETTVTADRAEIVDTNLLSSGAWVDELKAGRNPFHTFDNVTITFVDNGTFILYSDTTPRDFSANASFSIGLPVQPPAQFATFNSTLKVNTSLAFIGENDVSMKTPKDAGGDGRAILYSVTSTTNYTAVNGGTGENGTFEGSKYVAVLRGNVEVQANVETLLVPFSDDGNATFRPASGSALRAGLDLSRIERSLAELQGKDSRETQDILDEETTKVFQQVAPIINGALIAKPDGNLTIGGKDRSGGFINVLRYSSIHLTPTTDARIAFDGSGKFLLAGDQLHTSKATIGSPPFSMPVLSLVLWLFAIGAIVVGFVMKPFATPSPALSAFPIRIVAISFHIVCLIVLFVLWDMETKAFLGTSILTGIGSGGGIGLMAVMGLQLVPLGLAATLFGLPVRFIVNGGLRLVNMKKARGIGRGLGNLATWGLGAAFIPVILNPVVQMFLSRLH